MPLPDGNPQLPDHINNGNQSPLSDFAVLLVGVSVLVALLTFILMSSTRWLAPLLPYPWERQWLSHVQPPPDDAETQALQQLMERLLSEQPAPLEVTLHWLGDEPTPNAFATVGGHIFVTRGLLEQVQSENGLAMVLAHEYAHIEGRHPLTLMLEQMTLGAVLALLAGDSSAQVTQQASLLARLSFSRAMERTADARALSLLQAHYGHTQGADEFFRAMAEIKEEAGISLFQTHPDTDERRQRIAASATAHNTEPLQPLPPALK